MFSKFIKKFLLLFASVTLIFPFTSMVKAADANVAGVIISPPITEKEVQPGSEHSGIIKVTNPNTSTDLKITVSINDFKANGEEGDQTFVDPTTNTSLALGAWITIEQEFTLSANQTKEVSYKVKVPSDAEPGGHYGVIFFSPSIVATTGVSGSGVTAVPKIGSLLLFTVPGDIKYQGSIAEFSANKKIFIDSTNKVDLLTRFQNLSTNHVKPQGDIVITNLLGKEVATLSVNEKMGNVLPESIRKFENSWEKKYGFGLYKATVSLAFGDSGSAKSELSFWIIPWKETAGAIVILIILIWILTHLRWGGGKKEQPISAEQPIQQTPMTPPVQPTPTEPTQQPPAQQATPTPVDSTPQPQNPPNDQNIPKL